MKAALLGAPAASGKGVYLRMVEVAEDQLTDRHVPTITECDLPAGEYVWLPHDRNTYGGEFYPRKTLEIRAEDERLMRLEKKAKRK
jgi:hypothetical protein